VKYLLDINVLLAGIWTVHSEHARAFAWLEDKEIVICPITELGFIRISSNRRTFAYEMDRVRSGLEKFYEERKPEIIPDDLRPLQSHPRTSDEVTDHYLADLAAKYGLKFATFDRRIKHPAVELIC
jgi:predicted nucleic acid-binding protein